MEINCGNSQIYTQSLIYLDSPTHISFKNNLIKVKYSLSSIHVHCPNPKVLYVFEFNNRLQIPNDSTVIVKMKKQKLSYFSCHSMRLLDILICTCSFSTAEIGKNYLY